jgi:hypothetical protein
MPFTLCHPAAVIPLNLLTKGRASLPALVIGSMAPDFVYYFSLGVSGPFSHSMIGILLYCVPVGLVVYSLYYAIVREPLLLCMPRFISARMNSYVRWPLGKTRTVWIVIASLAVGAATHIVWDAFTHANTIIVNHYGILRSLVSMGSYEVPLFKVLQQMSSLVGFVVMASYGIAWLNRHEADESYSSPMSLRARLSAGVSVSTVSIAGAVAGFVLRPSVSFEHGLFNAVVTGMAAGAITVVLLCLGWQLFKRSRANLVL